MMIKTINFGMIRSI